MTWARAASLKEEHLFAGLTVSFSALAQGHAVLSAWAGGYSRVRSADINFSAMYFWRSGLSTFWPSSSPT